MFDGEAYKLGFLKVISDEETERTATVLAAAVSTVFLLTCSICGVAIYLYAKRRAKRRHLKHVVGFRSFDETGGSSSSRPNGERQSHDGLTT